MRWHVKINGMKQECHQGPLARLTSRPGRMPGFGRHAAAGSKITGFRNGSEPAGFEPTTPCPQLKDSVFLAILALPCNLFFFNILQCYLTGAPLVI